MISFLQAWTNNLPEAIVKQEWRRFKPACVFNPSHQGVAFKNRKLIGVNLVARYSLIALTRGMQRTICRRDEFAGTEERRGKSNHHPQVQRGRIILYSSVKLRGAP